MSDPREKNLRIAMGIRVKALRKAKGWEQSDLAEAAELSSAMISRVESGGCFLSVPAVLRIAAVFGVEPAVVLPDLDDVRLAGFK